MRNTLAPVLLIAVAAAPAPGATQPADQQFAEIWKTEWAWRQKELIADSPPGTVDAHLPDVSAAAQMRRAAYWADVARKIDAIPAKTLSPNAEINREVYRQQIGSFLEDARFREWEKPVNGDSAFWSDMQYAGRQRFRGGEGDYRNYLSWLGDLPRYFQQQIDNMRAGVKRGFTPPAVVLTGRDKAVEQIASASDPAKVIYFEPFTTMPTTIPAATQEALRTQARRLISQQIIPAHKALLTFLRSEYFPGATKSLAATALPDGKDYYQSRIRVFTTTDLTPDQIHALGLSEVAKIKAEMEAVRAQVGFKGDLPAFLTYLRTDPRFYPKTADELLHDAAWLAKKFDGLAPRYFGRMPRGRFTIVPVPPEIAPYYTAGRGGPDTYLVNTYNLPSRPLFQLPALTLHESAPGHSWQMSLASENNALPPFRRNSYISAFGEGWALYTERLGDEMGFYETPYERFGMLSYQMWRAARLVVDTGIHAKGWTREQAQKYLHDNTALSDQEVMTEVDRYIGWGGQALSYYLGERAIQQARAKAEKALGPKFDIRNFHDTVLSLGSVPLPVLATRIDQFIAEGGPSPYPKDDSD